MATLYLHVGMPKTGTTSLQRFLVKNQPALEEQGACYPDFSDIFTRFPRARNARFICRRKSDKADEARALERIEVLAQTHERVILSDEYLWKRRVWDPTFWDEFTDEAACFGSMKMVVYLRRQDLFLHSWWAQSVKIQSACEQRSFADYVEETGILESPMLDYAGALDVAAAAIGRENVLVRVFDKPSLEAAGGIVADFLSTVGLRANGGYKSTGKAYANPSLKDSVLETKRLLNRNQGFHTRASKRVRDPYTDALLSVQEDLMAEGLLGQRTGFSSELRREILERFREGNERVAREYLGREDGILFAGDAADDADDAEALRGFTADEIVDICGRVITKKEREHKKLEKRKNAQVGQLQKKVAELEERNRELEERNRELEDCLERTFARRVKRFADRLLRR